MTRHIKGFNDFHIFPQGEEKGKSEINENAGHSEISEKPISYKGYYLTIWPFHNDKMDPNMSWGFTISGAPDGENYISKTKGPAGNHQDCLKAGTEQIDHMVNKGGNETI
jgi:hypothetical protein